MTPQHDAMLVFLRDFMGIGHRSPTVRELARSQDLAVSTTHRLISDLVAAGHLERVPGTRGLRLPATADLRSVPSEALSAELARRGLTLAALEPRAPIATGYQRTCAADTCGTAVQRGHLMCRQHWFALSASLRQRILQTNARRDRAGFERAVTQARDFIDSGNWRRA